MSKIKSKTAVRGVVQPYIVLPGQTPKKAGYQQPNLVLYDYAQIVANILSTGLSKYKISGMYLEFENVASPGDAVSVPTFDESGGLAYYSGLSAVSDRDYLRVGLSASTVSASDIDLYPSGNKLICFAQTAGTTGVHGTTFSDSVNSKIFGGALVSMLDESDASQDLIFSRFYLEVANQQLKPSTGQVGLEWSITLVV